MGDLQKAQAQSKIQAEIGREIKINQTFLYIFFLNLEGVGYIDSTRRAWLWSAYFITVPFG